MAQYMNSNFDLAGPLAGLFGGIQQGQEEERSRLANLYQDLQNQRFAAETPAKAAEARLAEALAKAKMEGGYVPVAAQAAIKEQEAKLPQLDFSKLRSQADLADALYSTGTSVEQILPQFGIDPTSATGQAFLKDFPTAMTKFRDKLINLEADTAKQRNALELEKYKGNIDLQQANISAGAARYAADKNAQYKDLSGLAGTIKEVGQYVQSLQVGLTKLTTEEGKNEAINNLIASSGMTKEQATTVVNSDAYKERLQKDLQYAKDQYEHLKKQSPYFAGFNFSSSTPAPAASGVPAGVVITKTPQSSVQPAQTPPAAPVSTPAPASAPTTAIPAQEPVAPATPQQVAPVTNQNPALGRVFMGDAQPITNTPTLGANRGYVPTTSYSQYQHDRTASRKQAQIDQANREVQEATLEVHKWSTRDYPYGRSKLKEAEENLKAAQQKLNSLQ